MKRGALVAVALLVVGAAASVGLLVAAVSHAAAWGLVLAVLAAIAGGAGALRVRLSIAHAGPRRERQITSLALIGAALAAFAATKAGYVFQLLVGGAGTTFFALAAMRLLRRVKADTS